MRFQLSDMFFAWITLVLVWILELVVYVLGLLRISGDQFEPEEIFYVGLIGGPIFSAVALLVLVMPQALLVRWMDRRFRHRAAVPYMLFFVLSVMVAAFLNTRDLIMGQVFDAGVFGCRVAYVQAGSTALWFMARRHSQVV